MNATVNHSFANPWKRALAFLLETAIIGIFSFGLMVAVVYLMKFAGVPKESALTVIKSGGFGLPVLFYFVNEIILPATYWQTTLGGRLLKFYIIRKDGGKVHVLRIALRYALFIAVPALPAVVAQLAGVASSPESVLEWLPFLLWVAPALFTKERTTVHDLITRTRVVKGRTAKEAA